MFNDVLDNIYIEIMDYLILVLPMYLCVYYIVCTLYMYELYVLHTM